MMRYAEPVVCESLCVMPSQVCGNHGVLCSTGCVGIMMCYAELVVGNHGVNAVPVDVNHGELC